MQSPLGPIEIPPIPEFGSIEEELDWLRARHDELEFENAELRIKNQLWLNQLYGSRSERGGVDEEPVQQQRIFDTPVEEESGELANSESDADEENDEDAEEKRKRGGAKKRDHARKPVNKALERLVREHGATGPRFDHAGHELCIIGWDERERVHIIPEQIVCLVDRYAIWGLKDSRETVETTPCLPSVIPGGKLSDDFLCEIARRKYLLSLPLHRQLRDFNALGAELAVSTMCDGIRALATFLAPIYQAILQQILAAIVIHIDETTMKQQCDEHGKVTRYLWGWHANRQVCFHYGSRSAEEIRQILSPPPQPPPDGSPRYALTDGYAAYDKPLAEAGIIHAGCWAHIRRDFKNLAPHFQHGKEIFNEICGLYRCEKSANKEIAKKNLHGSAADACRLAHRQHKAQPALDRIAGLVERYRPHYKPKSLMGEALTTLHNQFRKLRVYASTGCVPIDNNTVERDMRQVAIGRKNYLFVGSEDAGSWCATMYSLIESARLCNIDVRHYLSHAVAGLHAGQDPATLTPLSLRKQTPKAKA